MPKRLSLAPSLQPVRRRDGARAAILFVHGFGGDIRETWAALPQLLATLPKLDEWDIWLLGYPTRLWIDIRGIWSGDPGLDLVAQRLRTDVALRDLRHYEALGLVGHSMGGLVLQRALVDDAALRERVTHLVLFGTPSGGLRKAGLTRWLKPQLAHMASDGPFVLKLRQDWSATIDAAPQPPFRTLAVAGERDEFVPASSSLEPFRRSGSAVEFAAVPGNHIELVKPESAADACVQVIANFIAGARPEAGPAGAAALAIELKQFQRAVDDLLPRADELDADGRTLLAIGLDGLGRRDEAIDALRRGTAAAPAGRSRTDAMGLLAGCLKRRWVKEHRQRDGEEALALYADAYEQSAASGDHRQAYYHAINGAFMSLVFSGDRRAADAAADQALDHCRQAADGRESDEDQRWRLATEAEAYLLRGDDVTALARYREALDVGVSAPWQVMTIYRQAMHLASRLPGSGEQLSRRLDEVFKPRRPASDGAASTGESA